MKFPKTPKLFDYDLWIEQDGTCMVRIKATGETTAVSKEVMKALRAEEKRVRRWKKNNLIKVAEGEYITRNLSYDQIEDDDKILGTWLSDDNKEADMVLTERENRVQ